jgi:adenylate kinase
MATIRSRVESRVLCASCGRTFNVGLHLSTPTAPCPSCSGVLVRRTDDTPETLAVRMGEYSAKTEPLISRYSAQKLLHRIDACRAPESVFGSIAEILERA